MLEGQIDADKRIEKLQKQVQSERHWRKAQRGEGGKKPASRRRKLSRVRRSCLNSVLLGALRTFVNETGMAHSEIANEVEISPGSILGWMHGSVELRNATLVAINDFLGKNGPE